MISTESFIEQLLVHVIDGMLQTIEHGLTTFADKARNPNRVKRMSRPGHQHSHVAHADRVETRALPSHIIDRIALVDALSTPT